MKKTLKSISLAAALSVAVVGCGSGEVANTPDEGIGEEISNSNNNDGKGTKESSKGTLIEFGENFDLNNWKVVLNSWEFNQSVEDDLFSSSADEGDKYLVLKFSVTNNGTEADSFTSLAGSTKVKAMYDDKYEYNHLITMIDGDLSNKNVQPLSTADGFVVIKVPEIVESSSESITLNLKNGKDEIHIKLR
ncbi:hypothetical protein BEP19_09795 [Ammoniphilus oxalaticus]|uniref:Uncharacterized protein n=1 Tax=Ammoniphilus oxalaticus TaxID=66863 RepID=A0A419SFH6_9BACL|nr:DUF4352 domain-containing protein [Ammoniphilus oxalaticus]RKD22544.1 hypothetical protein BEP19_09795 [Ammoniphilus oxalaticus]